MESIKYAYYVDTIRYEYNMYKRTGNEILNNWKKVYDKYLNTVRVMNTYEAESSEAQISKSPTKLPSPTQPPHPKCEKYHRRDPNEVLVVTNFIIFVNKNIQKNQTYWIQECFWI